MKCILPMRTACAKAQGQVRVGETVGGAWELEFGVSWSERANQGPGQGRLERGLQKCGQRPWGGWQSAFMGS